MNFAREMLMQITLDVCSSVFSLPRIRSMDRSEMACDCECLEGSIGIAGDWNVELRVVCPRSATVRLAAIMFDRSPADLSPDDVKDALTEIIQEVGDHVRSALGGETRLSFPRVREGVSSPGDDATQNIVGFQGDILTVHLTDTAYEMVAAC